MAQINRMCVFCGSSAGNSDIYSAAAVELGKLLVERKIDLVYGAGNAGLMGILAREVLEGGGKVIGVIPEKINAMVSNLVLTEKIVTATMHERKQRMYELSDAFIAMPGGIGTMEEIFEIFTWRQLGYHTKPLGLLNTGGFYDDCIGMITRMHNEGFLKKTHAQMLKIAQTAGELLPILESEEGLYAGKFSDAE